MIRGNQTVCVGRNGGGSGGEVTVNVSCDGSVYSVIARNCSNVINVPVDEDNVRIDSSVYTFEQQPPNIKARVCKRKGSERRPSTTVLIEAMSFAVKVGGAIPVR